MKLSTKEEKLKRMIVIIKISNMYNQIKGDKK